jgi:pyruvate kinase
MPKRTKIIATIGPAASSSTIIAKLIRAGMDAARLNFSHGDWSDHTKRIRLIRQEADKAGKQIAIIQDLQGPKLRVGAMKDDAVTLTRGDEVSLTTGKVLGSSQAIPLTYPRLTKDLKTGDMVLMDDGRLELKVIKKSAGGLRCKVIRGGMLRSHKGVNLPGANLLFSSLTQKDKADLRFGIAQGVDYIALSVVRTANDIIATRLFLKAHGADIPIIAKIESGVRSNRRDHRQLTGSWSRGETLAWRCRPNRCRSSRRRSSRPATGQRSR